MGCFIPSRRLPWPTPLPCPWFPWLPKSKIPVGPRSGCIPPGGHAPDCDPGRHLRYRPRNRGRAVGAPEAGLAGHVPGTAARHPLARHLQARLRAAGPPQLEGCFTRWVQSLAAARRSHDATRGRHRAPGGGPLPREHGHSGSACDAGARGLHRDHRSGTPGWVCQKRIAQTIREQGADHVLALKDNQLQLLEAVVETFAVEQAEGCDRDCHQTVNKNHGRIETRRCGVLGTPEYLLKVLSNQNAIALPIRRVRNLLPPSKSDLAGRRFLHPLMEHAVPCPAGGLPGRDRMCATDHPPPTERGFNFLPLTATAAQRKPTGLSPRLRVPMVNSR